MCFCNQTNYGKRRHTKKVKVINNQKQTIGGESHPIFMTGQDLNKYYKILDVTPDTPWEDIKRAYHDMMKIWHPDRFAGDRRLQKIVEEKTKELTHAFKKIEEDYHSIKFYYDPLDEAKESSIETKTKQQTEPPVKEVKPKSSCYTPKQEAEEWLKKANETGDYRLVVDYLNKAIDLDPYLEEAYLERAETHVMLGNHEQALEDFSEVIKLNSKSFKGFRGRANTYSELDNHSQAITDFTSAIELEPVNYPELYYLRGKSHEKLGNRDEAGEDFKNAKVLRILSSESHGSQTSSELDDEWKIEEKRKMSFKQVRLHVTAIICVLVGIIALLPIFLSKNNEKGEPKKEMTKGIEVPASPSNILEKAIPDKESELITSFFERKKPIKKKVPASTLDADDRYKGATRLGEKHQQPEEEEKQFALGKSPFVSASKETRRDSRFIAYDDGTVLDTKTNLMWAAKDNGSNINWTNAKSYCENYRGGGYTDWRMPTQDELAVLYDYNKSQKVECVIYPTHVATDL